LEVFVVRFSSSFSFFENDDRDGGFLGVGEADVCPAGALLIGEFPGTTGDQAAGIAFLLYCLRPPAAPCISGISLFWF
jgi:hypothetical protein